MDYQSLPPESQTAMVAARIGGLEQEHFGIEINLRETLAHANESDPQTQIRLQEWRKRLAEIEASVAVLKEWQFELAVEAGPSTQQ